MPARPARLAVPAQVKRQQGIAGRRQGGRQVGIPPAVLPQAVYQADHGLRPGFRPPFLGEERQAVRRWPAKLLMLHRGLLAPDAPRPLDDQH